jgi:hypothetical protein
LVNSIYLYEREVGSLVVHACQDSFDCVEEDSGKGRRSVSVIVPLYDTSYWMEEVILRRLRLDILYLQWVDVLRAMLSVYLSIVLCGTI